MEELKQYVGIVKKNFETMNAPDYEGKEADLANQKEDLVNYEEDLKENSTSLESFDKIVSATVDYAANEISYSELEEIYNRLTK